MGAHLGHLTAIIRGRLLELQVRRTCASAAAQINILPWRYAGTVPGQQPAEGHNSGGLAAAQQPEGQHGRCLSLM